VTAERHRRVLIRSSSRLSTVRTSSRDASILLTGDRQPVAIVDDDCVPAADWVEVMFVRIDKARDLLSLRARLPSRRGNAAYGAVGRMGRATSPDG
jgi:hypothetical protein